MYNEYNDPFDNFLIFGHNFCFSDSWRNGSFPFQLLTPERKPPARGMKGELLLPLPPGPGAVKGEYADRYIPHVPPIKMKKTSSMRGLSLPNRGLAQSMDGLLQN